jgi:DNA invertase Pin-like site-specific DNA recombinase
MSSASQLKGDSLRRQLQASKAYAVKHNLQLDEDLHFQDLGVSAYHGEHAATGALSRFLQAIDAGQVAPGSYLLVESLDRLSRQRVGTAMSQFLSIVERGITIVTLSDGNEYKPGAADPMPLIQSLLIMSRAHEESLIKSQRLSAAWDNKRKLIEQRKLTSRCPGWLTLNADKSAFEIVEDRAQVVRQIFEMSGEGLGHYSICKRLNGQGILPFGRATRWGESAVEKVLVNRAVLGEFQPHRLQAGTRMPVGETLVSYFPAIITEELFFSVQAARRARRTGSGGRRGTNQSNLFTHIAKCARCGAALRMVNKGKSRKGGRYLRCSNSLLGAGCTSRAWKYDSFEAAFLWCCATLDESTLLIDEEHNKLAKAHQEKLNAERERLAAARLRRDKMFALLDTSDLGFIRDRLEECNREIRSLELGIYGFEAPLPFRQYNGSLADEISSLQDQNARNATDKRNRLSARLKEVVTSLRVATDGYFPDSEVRTGTGLPAFELILLGGFRRFVEVVPKDLAGSHSLFSLPHVGLMRMSGSGPSLAPEVAARLNRSG